MTFLPDQVTYYEQSFLTLPTYDTPAAWFHYKAREGYSTTYWLACATAYQICVPGFTGDCVTDSDKNLIKSFLSMHSHIVGNLPQWMGFTRGFWDKDVREITHQQVGSTSLATISTNTSSLTFSTARSKNYGRGGRPKFIILSEAAAYEAAFAEDLENSLADSLTEYSWRVDESTPKGGTVFHERFKAIRDKKVPGTIIRRFWYEKDNTILKSDSFMAREIDRTPTLTFTEEETKVAQRFTGEVSSHERIRWRRARIASKLPGTYGDVEAATSLFQQEHPEDNATPWRQTGSATLPRDQLTRLLTHVLSPQEEGLLVPGVYYRVWGKQVPSHTTIAGMDPARGGFSKTGDSMAVEILDPVSGIHLAELYGKANIGVFTRAACAFLVKYYPGCLYAIERNGVGAAAIEAATTEHYSPLYYKPDPRPRVTPEPGWDTTTNKPRMHEHLWNGLYNGSLITHSDEMLQDLSEYDPNAKDHTPDRVMALMIAQSVRIERGVSMNSSAPATAEVVELTKY
jgi:hypothetical protein